jgi:hypothetical protein
MPDDTLPYPSPEVAEQMFSDFINEVVKLYEAQYASHLRGLSGIVVNCRLGPTSSLTSTSGTHPHRAMARELIRHYAACSGAPHAAAEMLAEQALDQVDRVVTLMGSIKKGVEPVTFPVDLGAATATDATIVVADEAADEILDNATDEEIDAMVEAGVVKKVGGDSDGW